MIQDVVSYSKHPDRRFSYFFALHSVKLNSAVVTVHLRIVSKPRRGVCSHRKIKQDSKCARVLLEAHVHDKDPSIGLVSPCYAVAVRGWGRRAEAVRVIRAAVIWKPRGRKGRRGCTAPYQLYIHTALPPSAFGEDQRPRPSHAATKSRQGGEQVTPPATTGT